MERNSYFLNKDGQLSPGRVIISMGLMAAVVATLVGLLPGYFGFSANSWGMMLSAAALTAVIIGPLVYFVIVTPIMHDYHKQRSLSHALGDKNQLIVIDPLTRTLNRRGITSSLLEAMAQAQRYSSPLSIVVIDVDHLRKLNDRHGPASGDKALEFVSHTITDLLRLPDRVGRQTDDEFLIVMPQTKIAAASKVAERIRTAIEGGKFAVKNKDAKLSVSIGVTEFHKGQDLEKFLSSVQLALQKAKDAGRNRVVVKK